MEKKLVYFIMLISSTLFGQSIDSVSLYRGNAPGLIKEDIREDNTISGGIMRTKNITVPKLYIYKPTVKKTDACVIIAPGGGYSIVAIDHEGHQIAKYFNELGVTAIVLKYRLPQSELFDNPAIRPLEDLQQAIYYVRSNATQMGISTNKIGVMGFSAGGHLAANAATGFKNPVGVNIEASLSLRPDFQILIYPVISLTDSIGHRGSREQLLGKTASIELIAEHSNENRVNSQTPPVFLVSTSDDPIHPFNAISYYVACQKHKVPAELHIYEKGGHGYGLSRKSIGAAITWGDRLKDWLITRQLL